MNNSDNYNKNGFNITLADKLAGVRVAVAVVAVVLLVTAVFATYASAQKQVILQVGEKRVEVRSFAVTVGDLLREEKIETGLFDRVSPLPGTPLEDGMTVAVNRAVPVTLRVGPDESRFKTSAATVGDMLQERKIALGERDVVTPGLETGLESGMSIEVDRIALKTFDEEAPVEFKVLRENDNQLSRGITKVVQYGMEGMERRTWEVTYKNGVETERRIVNSTVVREPVDQVVRVGVLQMASRGGEEFRFTRSYEMTTTAYTHTGNNTYTGIKPRVGIVAVDPAVIPLGTRLFVEGYGYCRAMDVGSKIKGNRIDIFLETRQEAIKWGVKKVKVYVLE